MITQDEMNDLIEKCLAAHEAVMACGTPEMQVLSKALTTELATFVSADILGLADGRGTE